MENKKNIAFLLTRVSERGGISRVVSIISDEIYQTQLFNIHIISYQKREAAGYKWNNGLIFHDLLEDRVSMKKGLLTATNKLRKIISKHNIDVLISCGQLVGPLGVLGTLLNKTKLIYWSHTSFNASTDNKYKVINDHFTALLSAVTVTLTKWDQKNYVNGTLARKVKQIYNPIDPQLENLSTDYNQYSKKIISVGRLTRSKNFELLVDVAKIVLEKHADYCWHIYGSGEEEERIQNKILANNLEGRLVLKGQCSDLYNLYNCYSILVMTSRYEGFPMGLIEGMASKLPLISFDVPTGPNEIIRENVNGFLIKPFEIKDMANRINELIIDKEKRMAFSKNNVDFMDEFNIKSITSKWSTLLQELTTK